MTLAKNSFEASWLTGEEKALHLAEIDDYVASFTDATASAASAASV